MYKRRSCAHLSVTGSGTQELPAGVALPGAYDPDDSEGVSALLPNRKIHSYYMKTSS